MSYDPLEKAVQDLRSLVGAAEIAGRVVDVLNRINPSDRKNLVQIIGHRFQWHGRPIEIYMSPYPFVKCQMGGGGICEDNGILKILEKDGDIWYWCGQCGDGGG